MAPEDPIARDVPERGASWRNRLDPIGSIVCISTADWDAPLWTNKQHLMSRLSSELPVLYVDSLGLREPRVNLDDLRRIARRLAALPRRGRRDAPSPAHADGGRPIVIAPTVLPLHRFALARRLNGRILARALNAKIARLPRPRVLWSYNPAIVDELDLDAFDRVVYHCVDDYASTPGVPAKAVNELEQRFAARCSAVFASSPAIARRLERHAPRRTHLLANVADAEHFAQAGEPGPIPADLERVPAPRTAFVGALSDHKIDWPLVERVARASPERQFVLIGPAGNEQRMDGHRRVGELANVTILGARPYDELPAYLRGCDSGIIPYLLSTHTESIFPMKVWEYLAAGLPVVSTRLAALDELQPPVVLVDDAEQFAGALRNLDTSSRTRADRLAAARAHTWDDNLDHAVGVLERL